MALGSRRLKQYERAREAVLDIIASRRVSEFCVGITGNAKGRRAAYERWAKSHDARLGGFAVLDWDLSCDEVLAFERWLFESVRSHKKYANQANVQYFPNVNRKLERQVIYVAWWSPSIYNG